MQNLLIIQISSFFKSKHLAWLIIIEHVLILIHLMRHLGVDFSTFTLSMVISVLLML